MKIRNKRLKNMFLGGLILCGASGGLGATEIYNQDDKKIDLYGNIRGYVMDAIANSANVSVRNQWHGGLQTNSKFGSKFTVGNFFGHIELGLSESNGYPNSSVSVKSNDNKVYSGPFSGFGIRLMYGRYDLGDMGKVTFGRIDTPMAVAGFVNDVLNTDNGAWGFGALGTSSRKFQVQYYLQGLTVALIEDLANQFNTSGKTGPRIAATYEYKDDSLQARVGATYKYQYATADGTGANRSINAFHVLGVAKYKLSNELYASGMVSFGVNGDLYVEQVIKVFDGNYSYSNGMTPDRTYNTTIFSAYGEAGYSLTDVLLVRVGVGYQVAVNHNNSQNNFMLMANAPYKVSKNVILTPQVGYYGAVVSQGGSKNIGGLAAIFRTEFAF